MGKPSTAIMNNECLPGDRDDNLWITIDDYKPPKTQIEWEETCFLDESFHGYYTWPKMIKYSMNKRERYTLNNMPEKVAILYERFIDKKFLTRAVQFVVLDEDEAEDNEECKITFNDIRFAMFKVDRKRFKRFKAQERKFLNHTEVILLLFISRVSSAILGSHFSIIS
jgi:hypothetical protein